MSRRVSVGDALLRVQLVKLAMASGDGNGVTREVGVTAAQAARLVGAREGGWREWARECAADAELARRRLAEAEQVKREAMREAREGRRARGPAVARLLDVELDGRSRRVLVEDPPRRGGRR